jgi:hypothetical protein
MKNEGLHAKRLQLQSTWLAAGALLLAATSAGAQSGSAASVATGRSAWAADDPAWVLSLAGGLAQGPSSLPIRVDLGGARAIQLSGEVALDRGQALTLSLGRQFWGWESDDGKRRYPLRVELEGLRADVQREHLALGVSSTPLSDQIDVEGYFVNAMVRLFNNERTQGWIGGGPGRVKQTFPDASYALPGCSCLAPGSSEDTIWRVKLRLEWMPRPNEDSGFALFAEGGYSELPGSISDAQRPPTATYGEWKLWTLAGGVRLRFWSTASYSLSKIVCCSTELAAENQRFGADMGTSPVLSSTWL